MSSCRTPSNKVVNRLGQLRADKVVQHVGKVREVMTFPDENVLRRSSQSIYTVNQGCEVAWEDMKKFVCLPTAEKIG